MKRGAVAGWDVTRPRVPSRTAGVSMAGFHSRGEGPIDVRVVPHPAITLVLEFGNGPLVVDTATGRQQRGNLVAGFLHNAMRVRGENIECLQVRLSPLVARTVLGTSPSDLDHTVVTLDDLWGKDATQLQEQLGETTSWHDRFALTEALLTCRAAKGPHADPRVAWAWNQIAATRGQARIEDLAAELGWSRKRLWSRFRSQIGLPPKRAARLVRFDHAAHRLATGESPARVAAESGYVDQSHLHRDVQTFTAVTPATMVTQPWLAVDDLAWTKPAAKAPAPA
ncbi:helix-turn-helix domain-containing protein [Spirillospora sp. CA-294931]|uniref:AraC family transcriptional regulator n=1 Tax=Spirillospora sp. CA-294931 TaxID=3240042 RepID=UPI003D909930